MFWTTIDTTNEQAEKLYDKHLTKGSFLNKSKRTPNIVSSTFSYDDEDQIGFVTLKTGTGLKVSYQLRGDYPCFANFYGIFGDIRYDIAYIEDVHVELYNLLQKLGVEAKDNFWKGGEI